MGTGRAPTREESAVAEAMPDSPIVRAVRCQLWGRGVLVKVVWVGGKGGQGDETNLPVEIKSAFHLSFMAASRRVMLSR